MVSSLECVESMRGPEDLLVVKGIDIFQTPVQFVHKRSYVRCSGVVNSDIGLLDELLEALVVDIVRSEQVRGMVITRGTSYVNSGTLLHSKFFPNFMMTTCVRKSRHRPVSIVDLRTDIGQLVISR